MPDFYTRATGRFTIPLDSLTLDDKGAVDENIVELLNQVSKVFEAVLERRPDPSSRQTGAHNDRSAVDVVEDGNLTLRIDVTVNITALNNGSASRSMYALQARTKAKALLQAFLLGAETFAEIPVAVPA